VLGSTVFSIAGLCAAHACLDDQALLAAREAIGSSLQTLGSVYAVLLAFVVFVVWQQFNDARGFVEKEYALHGPRLSRDRNIGSVRVDVLVCYSVLLAASKSPDLVTNLANSNFRFRAAENTKAAEVAAGECFRLTGPTGLVFGLRSTNL
jgi:hypothetical protein